MNMVDRATDLVENGVNNALNSANAAIDQAQALLRNAATHALEKARAEVMDRARDALGMLAGALDALPTAFPNLPADLPASSCPYVNALRDALARRAAAANNALGLSLIHI